MTKKSETKNMKNNLFESLAYMLDLRLGEEFKTNVDNKIYWFDLDGFHSLENSTEVEMLYKVLSREVEIIKLPWRPKMNEYYYSFALTSCRNPFWKVEYIKWTNSPMDVALWSKGWVFKTLLKAEDILPKAAKEHNMEYLIKKHD